MSESDERMKVASDAWFGNSPPHDGREWENQCARCGSSVAWVECEQCGGEGVDGHDCGEDCCCCADPEDNMRCDICGGQGGWYWCLADEPWCDGHPMPGRDNMKRGTVEWFPLPNTTEHRT
jgi:hypothetical protein